MQLVRPEVRRIEIPAVEWIGVDVLLVGLSPLIVNNFDEKSKQQMADAQSGAPRQRRSPKVAKECYERARVRNSKGQDCVPALWIKCATVDAARYVEGIKMTELRGAVQVVGELLPIKYGKLRMRCDTVRNANGIADLRYRPEYTDWSVQATIRFRDNILTLGSLINLMNNAGQCVGLAERRPAQNGDSFGMFEVRQVDSDRARTGQARKVRR
jgi:hypothetical protein